MMVSNFILVWDRVKPDNSNLIYTIHPETGEKIVDLGAMIQDRKEKNIVDSEIWPDTTGWNIADSKYEPTQSLSYISGHTLIKQFMSAILGII